MTLTDVFKMSFANLRRTKLRTILTTSGVIIGIGALISMVSFGTGMQKNVTDSMEATDVFTSIQVFPKKIDLEELMTGAEPSGPAKVLTDSTVSAIASIPGVQVVYPEIVFPAKVKLGQREITTTVQALPAAVGDFKPFCDLKYGRFFKNDHERETVVAVDFLRRLKVQQPDSVLGMNLKLITAKMDFSRLTKGLDLDFGHAFAQEVNEMKIVGVWERDEWGYGIRRRVIVPLGTSKQIKKLNFGSVFDLLRNISSPEGYSSLNVKVKSITDVEAVQEKIEAMGYGVVTIFQQLSEIKKAFLIVNAGLGTVGTIALIVAALGIINTMVMSVLERYREIGIMKAIGATNGEIKRLFFFESSIIGSLGGVFGIILGWLVTRVANLIGNYFIIRGGGSSVELFYIPWWLIMGGILFAIGVSLIAGLYPAGRAAKVDPVRALRYE